MPNINIRRRILGGSTFSPGVYVSSVALNGIPIGDDTTGDGTPQKPYLTIDKGYTSATSGQTIWLNGSPGSPTDYRHATFLNITRAQTIDCVRPYGASISSTTTTARAVNVGATAGAPVTFGRVIVDARGLCPSAVSVSAQATLMALTLQGTRLINFTQSGVGFTTSSAISFVCDGAEISNSTTDVINGAVFWLDAIAGSSLTMRNCTVLITSQTGGTQGAVRVRGSVANIPATISNCSVSLTVKSGLAASANHYGLVLENTISTVENNAITVSGGSATHPVFAISITPSTSAPAYSITGSRVAGNTVTHSGVAGIIIMAGQDVLGTVADGVNSVVTITGNSCTGSATGVANGLHGILTGANVTASVTRNRVTTTSLGLVDKVGNSCLFAANLVQSAAASGLRVKGGQNGVYRQNTFIEAASYSGDFALITNNDAPSITDVVGAVVDGNIFYTPSLAAGGQFVNEAASQGVTYSDNNYFSVGAATAPWTVGASNYANLAAWQAAHEVDAQGVDPAFVSPEYTPSATSLFAAIPRSPNVLSDILGAAYADPATVGAFRAT